MLARNSLFALLAASAAAVAFFPASSVDLREVRYAFHTEAKGANLSGITNPVQVSLGIGDAAGLTFVEADFDRDHQRDKDWKDHWH